MDTSKNLEVLAGNLLSSSPRFFFQSSLQSQKIILHYQDISEERPPKLRSGIESGIWYVSEDLYSSAMKDIPTVSTYVRQQGLFIDALSAFPNEFLLTVSPSKSASLSVIYGILLREYIKPHVVGKNASQNPFLLKKDT